MSLRNAELWIIIFNDLANSSISKLSDDYEKFILTDLIFYKSKRLIFFMGRGTLKYFHSYYVST